MTEELDEEVTQYNEHGDYDPIYAEFVPLEEDYQEPEEAEYDIV